MSLFGLLGIGAQGLSASSFGTNVASQNASNVATPGYARRSATLEPIAPPPLAGGGVRAVGARRIMDSFVERRMLGAAALLGEASARSRALASVDAVLSEGAGSVGDSMDAFWASLADLSARPGDGAARSVVLERAGSAALAFRNASAALESARAEIDDRVTDEVRLLQDELTEIGRLGAEISKAELGGQEASDLRDMRDQLVRQVAARVPVTRVDGADGKMSLLLQGGGALVSADGHVHALEAAPDPTTGDVHVYVVQAGARVDVTAKLDGGSIGGALAARDGTIEDARTALDQLAFDVATAVNGVHAAGFGLDGVTGRNLFTPMASATGAAAAMSVSTDVLGNPDAIAAATDPLAVPGDNRNVLALQALQGTAFAAGATATPGDALSQLVGAAGAGIASALADEEAAQRSFDQITALREAVSGVSVDEEMIALTKFQRAYQASLRVIQLADEMLGELLELGR